MTSSTSAAASAASGVPAPRSVAPFSTHARVAVVDDNQAWRNSLSALLTTAGFVCEAHESVSAFIRAGGIHRIQCLILDILMPEIDGLALQDCLHRTNYNIPTIFCSGLEDDHVRRTALANGAISYLRKPVEPEALIRAVQEALALSDKK